MLFSGGSADEFDNNIWATWIFIRIYHRFGALLYSHLFCGFARIKTSFVCRRRSQGPAVNKDYSHQSTNHSSAGGSRNECWIAIGWCGCQSSVRVELLAGPERHKGEKGRVIFVKLAGCFPQGWGSESVNKERNSILQRWKHVAEFTCVYTSSSDSMQVKMATTNRVTHVVLYCIVAVS